MLHYIMSATCKEMTPFGYNNCGAILVYMLLQNWNGSERKLHETTNAIFRSKLESEIHGFVTAALIIIWDRKALWLLQSNWKLFRMLKLTNRLVLQSPFAPNPASTQRWNNVESTLNWIYDVGVRCFNVETTLHFWRCIYNVVSTLFQRRTHTYSYMSIYQKMIREHRKQTLTKHQ